MRLFLIKSILYTCAWLPLPVIHGLGVCIGWGLRLIPNNTRQISKINIARCLPELTPGAQRALLKKSLLETGKTIIETSALWFRSGPAALRLIRRVENNELVEQAMAAGKGVILATPHLGAWEAAGLYGSAAFHMTCLYRPLKIAEAEELVRQSRNRLGGNYVPATAHGIRSLYRALDEGRVVAMLPDQEPKAGTGVFAPFFGIPAYSMVFLSRLSQRSGAPIIFAWCERLSWGRGYHLHFRAFNGVDDANSLEDNVAAVNRAVESCVRECPQQYQWGYKRFKSRPAGERDFYKAP